MAVQKSPGETSKWRSGEDRGIDDAAGFVARCASCRAWRHHSQFASRETCCHQRHSRAPCLTRITRPKSLQGKRPSKARSAQHARADAHTASAVAPRVFAVTRRDGHASLIAGCQPQARAACVQHARAPRQWNPAMTKQVWHLDQNSIAPTPLKQPHASRCVSNGIWPTR